MGEASSFLLFFQMARPERSKIATSVAKASNSSPASPKRRKGLDPRSGIGLIVVLRGLFTPVGERIQGPFNFVKTVLYLGAKDGDSLKECTLMFLCVFCCILI